MESGLAVHGINKRHVVDARGEPRKQIAHPQARIAVLPKLPVTRLTIARLGGEELQLALWIKRLAGSLLQYRLVIEGIDLAHAPGTENLNHTFCFGRTRQCSLRFGREQRGQRQSTQAASRCLKERAPRMALARRQKVAKRWAKKICSATIREGRLWFHFCHALRLSNLCEFQST